MDDLLITPIGFAEELIGSLYPWQDEVLQPLAMARGQRRIVRYKGQDLECPRRVNIALCTPNGAGKDSVVIAGATHWWLALHPRGKVVITSKSDLQLTQQTIPSIERHKYKFEGYVSVTSPRYELETKTGGKCIAFVTNNAARVEGWHKEDDVNGPLLLIVNEAKSVDEEIFAGLDRCTPNAVMLVSSPGLKRGRFYETFTKLRANWITVKAGLLDCPHIPQDRIDHVLSTWGKDHPFTKSTLYGEFMDEDDIDQMVVSLGALERCYLNPPARRPGMVHLFCDFAGGGAQNVIVKRDGNIYTVEAKWRDADKMRSVGRFIQAFRKLGVEQTQITGDAADKEMCDYLRDAGWTIHRQNFGAPALNKDLYVSWSAEAWIQMGEAIEKCEVILPDDEELKAQLTSRKKVFTNKGKLGLEDKFTMKKESNLPSPDIGDALAGAMSKRDMSLFDKIPIDLSQWRQHAESEVDNGVLAGIGAGGY